jgi:hypothetical protein
MFRLLLLLLLLFNIITTSLLSLSLLSVMEKEPALP